MSKQHGADRRARSHKRLWGVSGWLSLASRWRSPNHAQCLSLICRAKKIEMVRSSEFRYIEYMAFWSNFKQFQNVLGIDLYRRITLSLPHCAKGDTQKQKGEMARSSVLKLTKNGTNSLALYRFHRSHCHHHTGTDWAKHSKTIHLKGVRFMPKITMTVLLTYKFKIVLYLCFHTKRAAWINDSINISMYVIPHWHRFFKLPFTQDG